MQATRVEPNAPTRINSRRLGGSSRDLDSINMISISMAEAAPAVPAVDAKPIVYRVAWGDKTTHWVSS